MTRRRLLVFKKDVFLPSSPRLRDKVDVLDLPFTLNLNWRIIDINFYQNMPDTIYDDLKEQGLILSEGATLALPPIRPPKPTLVKKLVSALAPEFKLPPGPHKTVILPILNSAVIIARANTLICYKFQIEKETSRPIFQQPKIQNLEFAITKLHVCDSKFLNDRGEVPFLVQGQDRLVLFYVDLKEYKLIQKNTLSYNNLFSVRFLCQKQVLILTKSLELHHYTIQNGKIKLKNKKISANLPEVPKDQYIHHCQIVGSIDEEQDTVVTLFYLIKKLRTNSKNQELQKNFQILKVKEYVRTYQGKIQPQEEDYTVLINTHSTVLPENFQIYNFDFFYTIETKFQILILKKKFKKYLFIDNVMENLNGCNLKINPGAVISSYSQTDMELSVIQFGDPKCFSKILDIIDLKPVTAQGLTLSLVWPFMNQKETCLMVAFEKQRTIVMHNLIKMKPMDKMLEVVKGIDDKKKITMVQQIAVNLGINKKDFYLTLWQSSKRQINDIHTFLIPCGDVASIKKEIRLTMRRKKIMVPEFIKILEKIAAIIKHELKTNLSQQMLKEYIKNDFLLRKVKLKQKDKSMDHRDLQKVYDNSIIDIFAEIVKNKLCPQVKKVDPLHAMVDPPEVEVMDLRHVFQEFRIVILQNYKNFLVDFLAQFKTDQIKMVIEEYSNILLPYYPFELTLVMHENQYKTEEELKQQMALNSNGQNLWFSHMNSVEFSREMSKERIQRQLHQYYPTSKISDAINTLVNSAYGASQKLKKHGLISCTIEEYKNKLQQIYNNRLFLKVCEFANEKEDYDQDELSPALVQIFKKENRLVGEAYETVRLYTSMHKFMLKNDFCEKKNNDRSGFTTEELIHLKQEDLIALFFLENRQRKEFIFNQFRDLYVKLYQNPEKFNEAIKLFISSQNCSRIELEIFIKEVLNKGSEFQIQNQALIELLIQGFCNKLEIREDTDTKHFIQLMEQIELSKDLGMKMNKIIQIRRCLGILNVFNCQKLTYFQMLDFQRNNKIFKILLQKYFNQECKRDTVRIQDEQISLDYCRNMLTVLLYILETIYYDVTERDLLLTYGEILIEWKQFDVIKGVLYDEDVLEKLNIERDPYVQELVKNALLTIYTDQSIEFDEEVKRQIEDILDILPEENTALRQQEMAKLELVHIFEEWNVVVHPFDIYSVCHDWYEDGGKLEFIVNVFDTYIDKLTFKSFKNIYTYLEITVQQHLEGFEEIKEGILNNVKFAKFAIMFARRLLKIQRYSEIIEIFAFVKQMIPGTTIEYDLMTEAFLKQICILYPEQKLEEGKEIIEYFTQNYLEDHILSSLFSKNFIDVHFNEEVEREDQIMVDPNYCFKKERVYIGLDVLWKVVIDQVNQRKDSGKLARAYSDQVYYCYYFMLSSFRNPHAGLRTLDSISYNLEILTNLLFRLDAAIDEHSNLWAINIYYLFKSFIKGLVLIGVARFKEEQKIINAEFKGSTTQENIQVIKNGLKEDKVRNKDLLESIQRLQVFTNATKATKKSEKQLRYEREKLKQLESKPKEVVVQSQQQPEIVVNNATINLRTMRELKFEYTQLSNLSVDYISEKEVLEAVYNRAFEEKEQARKKKKDNAPGHNLFLQGAGISGHRKDAVQKDINEKIPQGDSEYILHNYPREEIVNALRDFYDQRNKNFHEIVELLEVLRLGQPRKISLCKLYKYIQCQIPTEDLPLIFSFDFFMTGDRVSEDEFREFAYLQLSENIQKLFLERDNEYIRSIAIFVAKFLEANIFIERVYVDTLIYIIEKADFTSEMIVRFRTLMELISPDVMRENLEKVLQAGKERPQMKAYVKKQLQIWAKQMYNGDTTLLSLVRKY